MWGVLKARGETIHEYEDRVGPLNRIFMEIAERNRLARQGHFRKEQEDDTSRADGAVKPKTETRARGTSEEGFTNRDPR